MIYRDFKGETLSMLGFGCMRYPVVPGTGQIDEATAEKMIDYAYSHGVNYFDTAFPYHNGKSEEFTGRALSKYPRDSFYLASKYPGHQITEKYDGPEFDPARIFEIQLKRCGVDYFDFYLLHNVCEPSFGVYTDKERGIIDYFVEQKKQGRIRHLGFSSHAALPCLEAFLDYAGDSMEFCQIQLNYLDWTLQDAKAKYELLSKHGIPVWVMEGIRGGSLARLNEETSAKMKEINGCSPSRWALRWLQQFDNIGVILSGMTAPAQVEENIATFETFNPLNEDEEKFLMEVAEGLKDSVPCTACRYCTEGCPQGLDIPTLIASYNDFKLKEGMSPVMFISALPDDKKPSACIGCGACEKICPQKIEIPKILKEFSDGLSKTKNWDDVCRERFAVLKSVTGSAE